MSQDTLDRFPLTPAHRLFHETYARSWRLWQVVYAFRQLTREGIPLAGRAFEEKMKRFFAPAQPKISAESEINRSQAAADAATVIFAHTVVDGAAYDYCRVIALHAPQDWERDVENKQVKLLDVRSATYETILQQVLKKHLKQLEWKSLLGKIDLLHAKCPLPDGFKYASYVFDRERIERLDRTRHGIIHGDWLGQRFPSIDEDLDYFVQTIMYLTFLIQTKYDLQFYPDILLPLMQAAI